MLLFRVTRCVCEKIAQKVAQTIFLSKLTQNLHRGKKLAQNFGHLLYFSKNCKKQTIARWAKIRPIWPPCFCLQLQPVVCLFDGGKSAKTRGKNAVDKRNGGSASHVRGISVRSNNNMLGKNLSRGLSDAKSVVELTC
jgi:hypothetical protein